MPLCGRQRPAAHTSLALCEPPIATPGSGALASSTLSQWVTHTSSRGGQGQGGKTLCPWDPTLGIHPGQAALCSQRCCG